jgi:lysophospholipase L1-like esterase
MRAKRIGAVLCGLVLAVVLVEVGFRAAGAFLHPVDVAPDAAAYRILCVGDSSTYGLGSSDRERRSYPSQLQRILSSANASRVQVVNLGLPGINSSQALAVLESNLDRYRPNLVLACAGMNDPWNMTGSVLPTHYRAGFLRTVLLRARYGIENLRICRFVRLCLRGRKRRFDAETVALNDELMPDRREQRAALDLELEENFGAMRRAAEEHGASIVFLEYHADGWSNPEIEIHRLYRELQLAFVPLHDYFRELDRRGAPGRSDDAWHPNDEGYRLLAERISNYLDGKIPIRAPRFADAEDAAPPSAAH